MMHTMPTAAILDMCSKPGTSSETIEAARAELAKRAGGEPVCINAPDVDPRAPATPVAVAASAVFALSDTPAAPVSPWIHWLSELKTEKRAALLSAKIINAAEFRAALLATLKYSTPDEILSFVNRGWLTADEARTAMRAEAESK